MPLRDYSGPSNSSEIFQHMVGERVTACFLAPRGQVWIVVESGDALVIGGAGSGSAVYWREPKSKVDRLVAQRRAEIEQKIRELQDLPGVELPKPPEQASARDWTERVLDDEDPV